MKQKKWMKRMKKILNSKKLIKHINRLVELWLEWMINHRLSNNTTKTFRGRRVAGETCEKLQHERQQILTDMNNIIERYWINND